MSELVATSAVVATHPVIVDLIVLPLAVSFFLLAGVVSFVGWRREKRAASHQS
jgi:hypothetical protein